MYCNYVNQKQSCDDDTVVLRDVHADMSGYYTCEVSDRRQKPITTNQNKK